MGRIKTKAVKGVARTLIATEPSLFKEEFNANKRVLGKEMPSKKVRNMVAGYLTRLKKQNRNILSEDE